MEAIKRLGEEVRGLKSPTCCLLMKVLCFMKLSKIKCSLSWLLMWFEVIMELKINLKSELIPIQRMEELVAKIGYQVGI